MTTVDVDKQRLLLKLLRERGEAAGPQINPVPAGTAVPLNSAQARIWFFCQQYPDSTEYSMPELRVFDGALEEATLTAAVDRLMRRHDALRLRMFVRDGVPVQVDHDRIEPPVTWYDLRDLSAAQAEERAVELGNRSAQTPFVIDEPYLFTIIGFALPDDRAMLALNFHHLNVDGISRLQFVAELEAVLHDRSLEPPAPVGFLDYVAWETDRTDEATLDRELGYWLDKLDGELPVLDLPRDRPRPSVSSRDGRTVPISIPGPLLARLQRVADDEGVTVYVVLVAAYRLFLARMGAQRDVIVGAPLAGRDHEATERILGCFVKTVPLRTDLTGDPTFREVVRREQETIIGAHDNQTVPYDRVVADLAPPRLPGVTPVFQTMVNLMTAAPGAEETNEPVGQQLESNSSQRELSLSLAATPDGLDGLFIYSADIFDPPTMQRFAAVFATLLSAAAERPDERAFALPMLDPAERERILHDLNPYRRPDTAHQSLTRPIEEWVRQSPDAIALHGADGPVRYADLDARAGRLARHLYDLGVRPGDAVALGLPPGVDWVVAVYAAAKLGAPTLTLPPQLRDDQIEPMLAEVGPAVVVVEPGTASRVPAGSWQRVSAAEGAPGDLPVEGSGYGGRLLHYATTITADGRAAVMYPVAAALARLDALQDRYPIGPEDVVLALALSDGPDAIDEIFWPLRQGAAIVVGPDDPTAAIDAYGVTILFASLASRKVDGSVGGKSVRRVFCDGDPATVGRAGRFPGELISGYGSAETGRIATGAGVVVRPAPHVTLYVLDETLTPTPIGVPGEVYVGGETGLPEAYLRAPALTAHRFVADPFGPAGARMYRTGDLGRYCDNGSLEVLGRIDRQTTVHGMRVDLAEVEVAFADQDGVLQAVVTAAPDRVGELAAFVVLAPGRELPVAELLDGAASRLPQYLVPTVVTVVDAIPETIGGGLDLEALLDLVQERTVEAPAASDVGPMVPATPLEAGLAEIYRRLLRRASVNVTDSFFVMGGHSLLVFKLIEECAAELGVWPTVQDVFTSPSVRELAGKLQAAQDEITAEEDNLVGLVENPGAPLLVFVHAASGSVLPFYEVAQRLGAEFAVYGLQSLPDDPPASIESIAAVYLDQVDAVRGVAPVVLAGWSVGGCVAVEMARMWLERDELVATTILIDTWAAPAFMTDAGEADQTRTSIMELDVLRLEGADADPATFAELTAMIERNRTAFLDYRPAPFPGDLEILRASVPLPPGTRPFPGGYMDGDRGWGALAAHVETTEISGSHLSLFDAEHADALAAAIKAAVDRQMQFEEI